MNLLGRQANGAPELSFPYLQIKGRPKLNLMAYSVKSFDVEDAKAAALDGDLNFKRFVSALIFSYQCVLNLYHDPTLHSTCLRVLQRLNLVSYTAKSFDVPKP